MTRCRARGSSARTPPPTFLFLQIQFSKSNQRRTLTACLFRRPSRQRVSTGMTQRTTAYLEEEHCPSRAASPWASPTRMCLIRSLRRCQHLSARFFGSTPETYTSTLIRRHFFFTALHTNAALHWINGDLEQPRSPVTALEAPMRSSAGRCGGGGGWRAATRRPQSADRQSVVQTLRARVDFHLARQQQ